ncbi:MAG: polysaccharide transporter [Bacilli bacterium]
MRTKKAIINVSSALASNFINIIIGFILQSVFIKTLGDEYLGLNGLFFNIVSMLSIAELGLSSAIIYKLYKPIAEKDNEQIKSLMHFYKTSYRVIAIVVFIIGLLIVPFINDLIGPNSIKDNIIIIYLIFLTDAVCSYLLTYKRSILIADQKNYYINLIHIVYLIILNVINIIILLVFKNYYLFLFVKVIMRIIENIVISLLANKIYPFLKDKNIKQLEKTTVKDIISKIKALFLHKIAGFVVKSTDNILITKIFGLVFVGLYSNYNLIINSLNTLIMQMFSVITSSVGNLLVAESKQIQFDNYKNIQFINNWIACFTSTCLFVIIDSFVVIWIGEKYVIDFNVLIALIISHYLFIIRCTPSTFKEAAGIFYEDRYIPILEASINLILSIVFANLFGLVGIFIGTICSQLLLHLYSYPKYVYKKILNGKYSEYLKHFLKYFVTFLFCITITYKISTLIVFKNLYYELLKNILLSLVLPNIIFILINFRTKQLKYWFRLVCNFKKNIKQ